MRRKHINAQVLASNVPPASPTFAQDTMARLHAMAAEEERNMKRKRMPMVLIAALLIVLLAATALAVSLSRSAKSDALTRARQALTADYGLTAETFGLFMPEIKQEGDAWVVEFVYHGMEEERTGTYRVTLPAGEAPQTSWTFDDVDPAVWQDGDMDAPVWGQKQMLKALQEKDARFKAYQDVDWSEASFETKAELHPFTREMNAEGKSELMYRRVPGPDDMPPEEAQTLAIEAILRTYGVDEAALAQYEAELSFMELDADGEKLYVMNLYKEGPYDRYAVWIESPSGTVRLCEWVIASDRRTLPDGPLDGYAYAVEAYMREGALVLQNAQTKADIVQRVTAAGMADMIEPALPYVAPGAQDLPEEEAVAAAGRALMDAYALNTETLRYFLLATSLLEEEGTRSWVIDFHALSAFDSDWYAVYALLGNYTVTLDAASGAVQAVAWDQEAAWEDRAYTEHDWGAAPVYHGKLLPWLLTLHEAVEEIAERYPADATIYDYSIEDAGAYDALFRAAGFSDSMYFRHAPGPEDVTEEEARTLAIQALVDEMPVTEETLRTADGYMEFTMSEDGPRWGFSFQFFQDSVAMDYGVSIDARTGEILFTNCITGGNG